MRKVLIAAAVLVAPLLTTGTAMAANARNPYGNIDRRVDAGNNTGDAQVEALNQQQLNRNGAPGLVRPLYPAPGYVPAYGVPAYPSPAYPPPVYAPRYYPPPPVVVAPYSYYPAHRYPYRYYPY